MSDGLRWILIVGCLLLATLEAPQSSLVLLQDLNGPWRGARGEVHAATTVLQGGGTNEARATNRPSKALNAIGACASVAPENPRVPDRRPARRLAASTLPSLVAIVPAR